MTLVLQWGPPVRPLNLQWVVPPGSRPALAQSAQLSALAAIIGPPGRDGPGAQRYSHTQSSAASVWVVNHNLDADIASVSVRNAGGIEVDAEIGIISPNQLEIRFAAPAVGSATIL